MADHAEGSPQGTCKATTKAGTRCKKSAVERGLCVFHSGKLDLAELGRQGGKARGKKRKAEQVDPRASLAWEALVDLATRGSDTARRGAAAEMLARLEPTTGGGGARAVELGRRMAYEEIAAEKRLEMPLVRARLLARLAQRSAAHDWRHGGWTLKELRARREKLAAELQELDAEIVNPSRKRKKPVSG